MAFLVEETVKNGLNKDVYIKRIHTEYTALSAAQIGSKNIYNADSVSYGVNGTFFYMGTPPAGAASAGYGQGNVYRIMLNNGAKLSSQPKSDINRLNASSYGNCGTFLVLKYPSSGTIEYGKITSVSDISYTRPLQVADVQFGVGGIDLLANKSFSSESTYNSGTTLTDWGNVDLSSRVHRTALIYRAPSSGTYTSNNVILLTAFSSTPSTDGLVTTVADGGFNAWDLYKYIRSTWPNAKYALMLDGGGSIQIVYKSGSTRKQALTKDGAGARNVQTMIRTNW